MHRIRCVRGADDYGENELSDNPDEVIPPTIPTDTARRVTRSGS
ncbi:MAG: hypothetical protein QF903_00735 [Planctomycetota bacterium]|nr:hypothetical protein [Planctomycetota bacterium]MDP6761618.1 hypothetical protein [Planctomycetota bacterium]MDP6987986.1 hypothetical protein [Planctomycetota bacterium]